MDEDPYPSDPSDLFDALASLSGDKYSERFHLLRTHYRFEGEEAIGVDILIPRGLPRHQHAAPVLVRIHGGFLVTGSSLYAPWFNTWILDYAVQNNAIIISPDYRLLPEVKGADIMEDISIFWTWLQDRKADELLRTKEHPHLSLDLQRLVLVGESAGGYIATQLALTKYHDIKSLIALYPMIDLKSDFWTTKYSKPIVHVPNRPNRLIEEHIQSQKSWVTRCENPARLMLAFSIVQNGRFLEFFGTETSRSLENSIPSLFPLERLDDAEDADGEGKGINLPQIFIFHGEQDSAVPIAGTQQFVEKLREKRPKCRLDFYTQDGDHGFDTFATLETPWLAKGLKPITKAWLGETAA